MVQSKVESGRRAAKPHYLLCRARRAVIGRMGVHTPSFDIRLSTLPLGADRAAGDKTRKWGRGTKLAGIKSE